LNPAHPNIPKRTIRTIIPAKPDSSPITAAIMSVWASGR